MNCVPPNSSDDLCLFFCLCPSLILGSSEPVKEKKKCCEAGWLHAFEFSQLNSNPTLSSGSTVFPKHVRSRCEKICQQIFVEDNCIFLYVKYIRAGADQNWLRLYCIAYRLIIFYSFWLKGDIKMQVIYSIVTGGLLVNLCTIICFKIG